MPKKAIKSTKKPKEIKQKQKQTQKQIVNVNINQPKQLKNLKIQEIKINHHKHH